MNNQLNTHVLVGLCGRSGSGKGYVSALFLELGIPSVDTDAVYRDMTAPSDHLSSCMQELVERFGEQIVAEDGSLNRSVMRTLVFGDDRQALQDLNKITHKHILNETLAESRRLADEGHSIILIDAPLLFESGFNKLCACTICVTAPESTLLRRIIRRDGISEDDARKRLATQKSVDELRGQTDFEIVNDCEKEVLIQRVQNVADAIRNRYLSK